MITHRFSDRIRFVSELELEHALVEGLEEAGELELEQAYVDFLLSRRFNVRAGMMLVPVGIINERHEPPIYYGVERPFVDTVIVPTTWFEVGAGVHGELGRGWRYRAYVMSPLNAREFTAEEGLRGGRQKGSDTNIGRPAVTGRLEYVGIRGLTVGASFWTGRSGFEFRPRFDVPVTLGEADVRYSRDRLELRGQFAQVAISNAGLLNDAMGRAVGVDPNVASALRGFYGEAGYRVISGASYGDVGCSRGTRTSTRSSRCPADYLPLRELDRDALVFGVTYWPDPDIALKADYCRREEQELDDQSAELVQHRPWMVVLDETDLHATQCSTCAHAAFWRPRHGASLATARSSRSRRWSRSSSSGSASRRLSFASRPARRSRSACAATTPITDSELSGTDINVTIPKRGKGVATVTFVPPQPGRYVFECSKLCGAGHGFMRGTLIAE